MSIYRINAQSMPVKKETEVLPVVSSLSINTLVKMKHQEPCNILLHCQKMCGKKCYTISDTS